MLERFKARLKADGVEGLRAGLIGRDHQIDGPFGAQKLLYADYTASGRALAQVEDFIRDDVLPIYANTHTEASYCGQAIGRLRDAARAEIARITGAREETHVIFAGSGATAAVNKLIGLLEIRERIAAGERVTILTGPYEHHSNILPWRETGATVWEVPEAETGGVCLVALAALLAKTEGHDLVVGSFSAASNVTGILTDPDPVTRCLKTHGALAVWDYAGGGPYLPVRMGGATPDRLTQKDAIVLSPHKCAGGPGASGLLLVRDDVTRRATPTQSGGGSVRFVSPWGHDYSDDLVTREEAGTPNILGDIRAALALLVKDSVGDDWIAARDQALRWRALARWSSIEGLTLLGAPDAPALPILSFQLRRADGRLVHHQLVCRMLSDHTGIQARAGCACAGPYAHRLMALDRPASDALRARITAGEELDKPGWVRLGLHYLHSDEEVDRILDGVVDIARRVDALEPLYTVNPQTARFRLADAA